MKQLTDSTYMYFVNVPLLDESFVRYAQSIVTPDDVITAEIYILSRSIVSFVIPNLINPRLTAELTSEMILMTLTVLKVHKNERRKKN
jgi:hypothetical protein